MFRHLFMLLTAGSFALVVISCGETNSSVKSSPVFLGRKIQRGITISTKLLEKRFRDTSYTNVINTLKEGVTKVKKEGETPDNLLFLAKSYMLLLQFIIENREKGLFNEKDFDFYYRSASDTLKEAAQKASEADERDIVVKAYALLDELDKYQKIWEEVSGAEEK